MQIESIAQLVVPLEADYAEGSGERERPEPLLAAGSSGCASTARRVISHSPRRVLGFEARFPEARASASTAEMAFARGEHVLACLYHGGWGIEAPTRMRPSGGADCGGRDNVPGVFETCRACRAEWLRCCNPTSTKPPSYGGTPTFAPADPLVYVAAITLVDFGGGTMHQVLVFAAERGWLHAQTCWVGLVPAASTRPTRRREREVACCAR
ncbi:hypothetical protein B0H11DRAFT_1916534 [Mycena galericulata]|nr:hypothetical protein B0H11DRAFT_1916534 [Mycena galericulata]